jgi:hypothetical protein
VRAPDGQRVQTPLGLPGQAAAQVGLSVLPNRSPRIGPGSQPTERRAAKPVIRAQGLTMHKHTAWSFACLALAGTLYRVALLITARRAADMRGASVAEHNGLCRTGPGFWEVTGLSVTAIGGCPGWT